MSKKIIITIIAIVIIAGIGLWLSMRKEAEDRDGQLIGGERDEYGCLGPAGYTWNENVGACVREWELNDNQKQAAKIAVDHIGYIKGLTILKVDVARCPGCFGVQLEKDSERINVTLENWKVVITAPPEEIGLTPEECTDAGGRVLDTPGGFFCDENEISIGEVGGFAYFHQCCVPFPESKKLTIEEAMEIARASECVEKGSLTEQHTYNSSSKTWWIDLEMKEEFEKEYCHPACVVSEWTKTAEINWRCMGALPPLDL